MEKNIYEYMPTIKTIKEKVIVNNQKYNLIREKGQSSNLYYLEAQKSSTKPKTIGIKECIRELAKKDDKEQLMDILTTIEKDLCKQLHKRNQLREVGWCKNLYKVNNTNLYACNTFDINKTEDWNFLDKAYHDIKRAYIKDESVASNNVYQFSSKNAKLLDDGYINHPYNLLDLYITLDIVNPSETKILNFISKAKEQNAMNTSFCREDSKLTFVCEKIEEFADDFSLNVENLDLSRNEAKIKHNSVLPYNDFKEPSKSKGAEMERY